jgi:hypothetical protein
MAAIQISDEALKGIQDKVVLITGMWAMFCE